MATYYYRSNTSISVSAFKNDGNPLLERQISSITDNFVKFRDGFVCTLEGEDVFLPPDFWLVRDRSVLEVYNQEDFDATFTDVTSGAEINPDTGTAGSADSPTLIPDATNPGSGIGGEDGTVTVVIDDEVIGIFDEGGLDLQEFDIDAKGLTLETGPQVTEIETTITDDDTKLPTSGAVVDYVGAAISFGAENTIPTVNAAGDDFDYSAQFYYNGTTFAVTDSGGLSGNATTIAGGDLFTIITDGTDQVVIDPAVVDGGSAVLVRFNSFNGITNDGAKLLQLQSGLSEKFSIGADGRINMQAGVFVNITEVNAATYDLVVTDYIVLVTYTTTGAVTSLTLPTAQSVAGRTIIIKDAGYNAATYSITIDTGGAETIDNAATYILDEDGDSVALASDGTDWHVI